MQDFSVVNENVRNRFSAVFITGNFPYANMSKYTYTGNMHMLTYIASPIENKAYKILRYKLVILYVHIFSIQLLNSVILIYISNIFEIHFKLENINSLQNSSPKTKPYSKLKAFSYIL